MNWGEKYFFLLKKRKQNITLHVTFRSLFRSVVKVASIQTQYQNIVNCHPVLLHPQNSNTCFIFQFVSLLEFSRRSNLEASCRRSQFHICFYFLLVFSFNSHNTAVCSNKSCGVQCQCRLSTIFCWILSCAVCFL